MWDADHVCPELLQRLGIFTIWIDAHGNGLDTGDGVMPDQVVRTLDDLLA